MPPLVTRHALRATFVGGLVAVALLTPTVGAAQFGGLGQRIGAKVLRDRGTKAGTFPPGFSDSRYTITTARLDAMLRGIAKYDAAAARASRAHEAEQAQQAKRDRGADRERASAQAALAPTMTYVACALQVNQAAGALPSSDPRRPKVDALLQHAQAFGAELERRSSTGQPIDTAAAVRRQSATMDSVALLTIGRRCPPMPKEMLEGDTPAATPSAPTDATAGTADVATFVQQETQFDRQQLGVTCDKIIAYFGAMQRKVEPTGFGAGELDALRARSDELRRHVDGSLCTGMP